MLRPIGQSSTLSQAGATLKLAPQPVQSTPGTRSLSLAHSELIWESLESFPWPAFRCPYHLWDILAASASCFPVAAVQFVLTKPRGFLSGYTGIRLLTVARKVVCKCSLPPLPAITPLSRGPSFYKTCVIYRRRQFFLRRPKSIVFLSLHSCWSCKELIHFAASSMFTDVVCGFVGTTC